MHSLVPITALGSTEAREDRIGAFALFERPGVALASLAARRTRRGEVTSGMTELLGAVPGPGEIVGRSALAGFWIGPDQWMIYAPFDTHEDLAGKLKVRFGDAASITEQSDAWACFDLCGPDLVVVMERLSSLDLGRLSGVGAHRTTIHHLGCFVITPHASPDTLRIVGPRASAGSLHHAILAAMRSIA